MKKTEHYPPIYLYNYPKMSLYNVKKETVRLLADIHSTLVKSNCSNESLCTIRDLALDVYHTNNGEEENGNGNIQE